MESKSHAGAGLYTFVCAVLGYCDVAKKIKPKREKVGKLEHEYQVSKRDLDKINRELEQITRMLAELSHKLVPVGVGVVVVLLCCVVLLLLCCCCCCCCVVVVYELLLGTKRP